MQTIDINNIVQTNPLTYLTRDFQTNLLHKIQTTFTDDQQHLFIASFYCYLNYNSKTDFVIDLDNVWKWIGFSRKDHCKRTLEKHFTDDMDYKVALPNSEERKKMIHKMDDQVNKLCSCNLGSKKMIHKMDDQVNKLCSSNLRSKTMK